MRIATIVRFFGLTYAITWILWTLAALAPGDLPLRTMLFLPGTFAPGFVAVWLMQGTEGSAGRRALVGQAVKWQVPGRWYLFALLYLAVIKLLAAVVHRVITGAWVPMVERNPWLLFLLATLVFFPVQAGEELGWRAYALPRMTARLGLSGAAILLGILWATWHLPLFFLPVTDLTDLSFPLYVLTVTPISVAMAWLYARSGRSLLVVMMMHAAVNNTPHFVPPPTAESPFEWNASLIQVITLLLLWIGAGYFLVQMRKVTLDEPVPTPIS
jgi:membrane protease YdiL (CAAX protease family)